MSIHYTWFLHLENLNFVSHFSWFGGDLIICWFTLGLKTLFFPCCLLNIFKLFQEMGYLQFCWWFSLVSVLAMTNIWWWPTFLLMPQFNIDSTIWPTKFLIQTFSKFVRSSNVYNGVFGSFSSSNVVLFSSSYGVFPFCYIKFSWFALYFKINNSSLSLYGSFPFLGPFFAWGFHQWILIRSVCPQHTFFLA